MSETVYLALCSQSLKKDFNHVNKTTLAWQQEKGHQTIDGGCIHTIIGVPYCDMTEIKLSLRGHTVKFSQIIMNQINEQLTISTTNKILLYLNILLILCF
jgi:hypothetical protein